jgi:hypothetical protein
MDLFSCRNCIQNPTQGLNSGLGHGFCLQWNSRLLNPAETTCKYHHRKDLPIFLVDNSTKEHAAEFAVVSGIANLYTAEIVPTLRYSEKQAWERGLFDPQLNAISSYHRTLDDSEESAHKWRIIQAFSGSIDGMKALGYSSLVRRYMYHCDNWWSSYRLVLAIVAEIDLESHFRVTDLVVSNGADPEETIEAAIWEVFFTRLSGIQEFAWHASLERIMFPSRELSSFLGGEWSKLAPILAEIKTEWERTIIEFAKEQGRFFPPRPLSEPEE